MVVLYDSLQLAHKCILNSFYGYVMRKARPAHMPMPLFRPMFLSPSACAQRPCLQSVAASGRSS